MKFTLGLVTDLSRIVSRRIERFFIPKFEGYGTNYKEICESIIDDCYYDGFFHVSKGHFRNFFVRDFSIVAKHLVNLGYKKQVYDTINFAFDKFMKHHITTTITKTIFGYQCYDLPNFGFDSIALFLKTIIDTGFPLTEGHKKFILDELNHMRKNYLDSNDLPKLNMAFSSIRDLQKRQRSCYDVAMLAYIQNNLGKVNISFEFKTNFREYLLKEYWNGSYFYDDITKKDYFSTDSNIFPFWLDVFDSEEMFEKVNKTILDLGLAKPLPIRYNSQEEIKHIKFIPEEFLISGYEKDVLWIHLGLVYLDVLKKFNKYNLLKDHLENLKKITEKYGNFVEVLFENLTPYKSLFYFCDESLSWCASFLDLYESINIT